MEHTSHFNGIYLDIITPAFPLIAMETWNSIPSAAGLRPFVWQHGSVEKKNVSSNVYVFLSVLFSNMFDRFFANDKLHESVHLIA